jgi:hypothetical protein
LARLYANENFPLPAVESLRTLGHDVLTSLEAGNAGQAIPDPAVLDFAVDQGRAILTLNRRHFVKLHQERPAHGGIVVCTFDADFGALAQRIHDSISSHSTLNGVLIRINRPATKA